MSEKPKASRSSTDGPVCFVIMPISDPEGYAKGHFKRVYDDIIIPACHQAGFSPLRADEVKQTNLIHLDILQRLVESPMALCDLSSRNPNVLFEVALRQAFDKPVALIREVGTPEIFDISPLRYREYRKERIYHEVLEDQKAIADALAETYKAHESGRSINSIVKLLALSKPASLPDIGSPEAKEDLQQLILAEIAQLRNEVRMVRHEPRPFGLNRLRPDRVYLEMDRAHEMLLEIERLIEAGDAPALERADVLVHRTERSLDMIGHSQRTSETSGAVRSWKDLGHRLDYLKMRMLEANRVIEPKKS